MSHRDGEQVARHVLPVVDGFVVEVGPVEVVCLEVSVRAGVGEVDRLVRVHGHEHLDQGEEPREDALVGVLADLVAGLAHAHAATLELDVDERHTVDEQHHVAAALWEHLGLGGEVRLSRYLVAAAASSDLRPVVDVQTHFFAKVQLICLVVACDGDRAPVDEAVEAHGGAQLHDLLDDLLHLAGCQGAAVEVVPALVVLEEDLSPVVEEVLLGGVAQRPVAPPVVLLEDLHQGVLECQLACEHFCHRVVPQLLDEHLVEKGRLQVLEQPELTLMKGDEVVEVLECGANQSLLLAICRRREDCIAQDAGIDRRHGQTNGPLDYRLTNAVCPQLVMQVCGIDALISPQSENPTRKEPIYLLILNLGIQVDGTNA